MFKIFLQTRSDGKETALLCKVYCCVFVAQEDETRSGSCKGRLSNFILMCLQILLKVICTGQI